MISKRPEVFLLGLGFRQINKTDRTLLWYMLAAARIVYAKYWKQSEIPRMVEWLNKTIFLAEIDKITRKLREQLDTEFKEDWIKLKIIR